MNRLRYFLVVSLFFFSHLNLNAMQHANEVAVRLTPNCNEKKVQVPFGSSSESSSPRHRYAPRPRKAVAILGVDGVPRFVSFFNEANKEIQPSSLKKCAQENNVDVFVVLVQDSESGFDANYVFTDCLASVKTKLVVVKNSEYKKLSRKLVKSRTKTKAVLFSIEDRRAWKALALDALPKLIAYAQERNDEFDIDGVNITVSKARDSNDDEILLAMAQKIFARLMDRILPNCQHAPNIYFTDKDIKIILDKCKALLGEKL